MNRASRIAQAWGFPANVSQAPDRAAAEVDRPPASAAFLHFTESCLPPPGGQVCAAPDAPPPASGAADLCDSPAALAGEDGHPGTPSSDVLAAGQGAMPGSNAKSGRAVTSSGRLRAEAVHLSDASTFILSLIAAHEGRPATDILAELIAAAGEAIGLHSLIMRDAGEIGDLTDVPDFARSAAKRFRRCGA